MLHPLDTSAGCVLVNFDHIIDVTRTAEGYRVALTEGREHLALPTTRSELTLTRAAGGVGPTVHLSVPPVPASDLPCLPPGTAAGKHDESAESEESQPRSRRR